ncbi:MAG TPA: radical SAM protein [bacterium]|nr:radical SAM protein [bacterium]
MKKYTPKYRELYQSGELQERIDKALESLKQCVTCPWECGVNRLQDEEKVCRTGRYARVTSYFPHLGEEDCLRGWRGSGTIFFGQCNLRCVFCQNYDISQTDAGRETLPEDLARMMLNLQRKGCHNINWVTPEHVVPQILEALPYAIEGGLHIPIVYNTSGFDSLDSLQVTDGIVDIYMPDFKYWSADKSKKYLKTADYPRAAKAGLKEMHRQVGDLKMNSQGLAVRGVLVRHLVMPEGEEDTRQIMRFLASELSPETYVNIMGQYRPAGKVHANKYAELDRRVTGCEMQAARQAAKAAGLHRFAA